MFGEIPAEHKKLVETALKNNINTHDSCSAGRLFDAVATLLDICTYSTYHAEAPLKLEHSVAANIDEIYDIELTSEISWNKVILQIISDLKNQTDKGIIAAKFHNTVAHITARAIEKLNAETGISKIILSGGSFQNKYLTKKVVDLLTKQGLMVYIPAQLPPNDGGIALGQMAIAAKKLNVCV
jgi:hydrogenase maturation protein HypF